MIPKLLFQEFWARGLDWNQPLDSDIENSWETWKKELPTVDQIRVPRCLLRNLCSVDKLSSMDSVTPAKEVMAQLFTFVLRTRLATESPT